MQYIDLLNGYWNQHSILMHTILAFGFALILSFKILPTIVHISYEKNLLDKPNYRKLNIRPTPNLGGVAIFIATTLSLLIFGNVHQNNLCYSIPGSCMIIFFIGLKDDLININPWKKLFGQLFAISIVVFWDGIKISNLNGFLNIFEINEYISIPLTFMFLIIIINSMNLIDGIDGLASGVTILISLTYGVWFFLTDQLLFAVISFSLAGSLLSFFYFNVFSTKKKIFMGDCGSLLIGFIIGMLTIFVINSNASILNYKIESVIPVVISILIVPIVDTVRIFLIRIRNGRSPFIADRNHIHHRLIDLNFSHLQATIIIVSANIVFIFLAFILQRINTLTVLITLIGLAVFLIYSLNKAGKRQSQNVIINNSSSIPFPSGSINSKIQKDKPHKKSFYHLRASSIELINSEKKS